MSFPSNVYLPALVLPMVITLAALPLWRRWCQRAGLVDDPGHRKIHAAPIPLAGGLAVVTGLLVPAALAAGAFVWPLPGGDVLEPLRYGWSRRAGQLGAILLGALGMLLLGILDDKHELKPAAKFGGQLLVSTLVAVTGIRVTLFVPNIWFSYFVTVLWILTVINAFNFMDNMNGLCAGLGVIASWCFALSAAVHGQFLVALLALQVCGALLGFIPFNFPKASTFLGDSGSHLVGYLMAVLAILPHFYSRQNPKALAVLSPLLILAVPLADLVWVVVLRWSRGVPFYVGDTNHLSHRLVARGWSQSSSVLLIWLTAALLGTVSLWLFL